MADRYGDLKRADADSFAALTDRSQDFIGMAALDGYWLHLNAAGRTMLGFDSDESITSFRIPDFHILEQQDFFEKVVVPAIEESETWSGRIELFREGSSDPVEVEAQYFTISGSESGGLIGANHREIVEQPEIAEELRKSEERLSLAVRAATDGLWDCDLVNGTVWWNETYDKLYGKRPEDTANSWQWWIDRIHVDDRERVTGSLTAAAQSGPDFGERWADEYRFRTVEGRYVDVVDRAYIARDAKGKATRILGAMQDISVHKEAERIVELANSDLEHRVAERTSELNAANSNLANAVDELKQSERKFVHRERLSAIGQMGSGVAHNLNNMLTPAVLLIDLILAQTDISDRVRGWAELIRTGTSDATDIVRQLRSFYCDDASHDQIETVDLEFIVGQIASLTRSKWYDEALKDGRSFELKLDIQDAAVVMGNPSDLRQVLTNLVFNAVDSMPNGGEILLKLSVEGSMAVMEVVDSGMGMDDEQLSKCFEPFFTTKETGAGLGLSMCMGIAAKHSGTLSANSERGEGTTFTFVLPLISQQSENPPVESKAKPSVYRILYIDDDNLVCKAMVAMLESEGHRVVLASSGVAAVELIENERFDVVVTDYSMPEMNGRQLAALSKKINSALPVILVTGWASEGLSKEDAPEDCILEKPLDVELLHAEIRKLVDFPLSE